VYQTRWVNFLTYPTGYWYQYTYYVYKLSIEFSATNLGNDTQQQSPSGVMWPVQLWSCLERNPTLLGGFFANLVFLSWWTFFANNDVVVSLLSVDYSLLVLPLAIHYPYTSHTYGSMKVFFFPKKSFIWCISPNIKMHFTWNWAIFVRNKCHNRVWLQLLHIKHHKQHTFENFWESGSVPSKEIVHLQHGFWTEIAILLPVLKNP